MKPLRLELQAFSSFKDKTVIDFSSLNERGIYLVSGATGSGKTTIFDAICYALFGEPSGSVRNIKDFRSDYAEDGQKTYVEFIFELQGKKYKIYRAPAQKKKTTNKNDAAAEAVFYYGENFSEFIDKPTDVNTKIESIFGGLKKQDFKQICMLAQGEFAKLLDEKTKEKQDILRNIFKTDNYQSMQNKFKARRSAVKTECDDLKSRMSTLIDALPEKEIYEAIDTVSKDPLLFINFAESIEDRKEVIKCKKAALEDDKAKKTELKDQLSKNINDTREMNKKIIERNNAKTDYEEELKKKDDINNKKKYLTELYDFTVIKGKEKLYESSNSTYSDLIKKTDNLKQEIVSLKEKQEELASRKEENEAFLKEVESLNSKIEKIKQIESIKQNADSLEKPYRRALDKYNNEVGIYSSFMADFLVKESAYFNSVSVIIAEKLVEGEECPVCGSKVHPHKAQRTEEYVSEEDYKKLKVQLEARNTEKEKANNEMISSKSKYESVLKNLNDLLEEENVEKDNISSLKKEFTDRANKLSKLVKEYNDDVTQTNTLLDSKSKQLDDNKNEIVIVKERVENNKQAFEDALTSSTSFIKETYPLFVANKYNEQQIKKETEQYQAILAKKEEKLRLLNEEVGDNVITDCSKTIEQLNNLSNQIQETENNIRNLHSLIDSYEGIIPSLNEGYKRFKEKDDEYRIINLLTQVIAGENGDKITFETYILGGYFDEIIEQANLRFKEISSSQYELRRRLDPITHRGGQGLDLDIFDYSSGKTRDIASLSGGERFKAALSLSLGLADIIESQQSAIEISSLFIDEGFGTLDQLSLEQAIKTLIELQGGNKTIGIISHVEQLKDMIDAQIVVKKTSNGSKLDIVIK